MGRFDHIQPTDEGADPTSDHGGERFDFDHYQDLAAEAHRRGRYQSALRYYGRALEQDRERAEAWLGQVRALLDMGQPAEALTWMEQAGRIVGEVPGLLALRAIAAMRSGAPEEARAWSDRSLRDGRDDPEVWLARAEVVFATGSAKMARVNLDKAHERQPGPEIARRCGEVALQGGDPATARTWLQRALRDAPEDPLIALRLGVCWERMGDLSRARAELERALSLEPGLESARLALDDLRTGGVGSWLAAGWRRLRGETP